MITNLPSTEKSSSTHVSLRDPDLNKKLPSYAITRDWQRDPKTGEFFGINRNSDTVPLNYWENSMKVLEYLQRVGESQLLDKCLEDPALFRKLLIKLHQIQTQGILRNKSYIGQSVQAENVLSENWQDHLRGPDFNVKAVATPSLAQELKDNALSFDREHYLDPKNTLINIGSVSKTSEGTLHIAHVTAYLPENLYSRARVPKEKVKRILEGETVPTIPTDQQRESMVIYFTPEAFISDDSNDYDQSSPAAIFIYPSANYIEDYIEIMREGLQNFRQETNKDKKRNFLANAYQAGIRSQAFETVWNSEMMGIVNYFLVEDLHTNAAGHGRLDYNAFFLSKAGFESYFKVFINRFIKR